ncbi:MAG: hypothetical protein IPN29_19255 [Saprospiraceae bacterium]|nr:hypothetical protein [Saprospiraceae bacterium]
MIKKIILPGCFLWVCHIAMGGSKPAEYTRVIFKEGIRHEFHISKTEINYDTKTASLQLTIHIFIDDLERALTKTNRKSLKLGTDKEATDSDLLISQYLMDNLKLESAGKKLEVAFLGKEPSEDFQALYCYLEVPLSKSSESLSISNNLLLEIYDDQKNMVIVSRNRKQVGHFVFDEAGHVEVVKW